MLSLLLALSCQDYSINDKVVAEPIIAPDFIDFGHLRSGHEVDSRQIIFSNGGQAPLHISHIEIHGERFDVDTDGFTVEPLSWYALDLSYIPETFEFNEGYLDVYMEGVQQPISSVWFQGWGDAPVLTVEPPVVDFGTLSEDCDIDQEIHFTNNGNLDLEINSIQEISSIPQQIMVDYGTLPAFPWTIPPQGRIAFWLDFESVGLSLHSLDLKVASNDPLEPLRTISTVGETMISTTMVETFIQGTSIYVDIIWIIDNSGSMRQFQQKLAANLSSFMTLFLSYSPDFKMAFITTDDFAFVNNQTFLSSDVNVVGDSATLINSIGTWGSAAEQGLSSLDLSITHNAGWFRQGASLVAIFLSDEQDWSVNHWTYYASRYTATYPNGSFLPYAIIGNVPEGCDYAMPGHGYYDLVNHFNSSWWSICDEDWGSQMEDIALSIINSAAFILDHPNPKEDTISVWVNGQEITEGWGYNSNANSIYFDFDSMPEAGDSIEVSYEIWECE